MQTVADLVAGTDKKVSRVQREKRVRTKMINRLTCRGMSIDEGLPKESEKCVSRVRTVQLIIFERRVGTEYDRCGPEKRVEALVFTCT